MNMISTGAFQEEMDASTKTETLAEKFARVWERKNSKAVKASGVSLMALTLAACGSDDETPVAETPAEEPVVVVPEGVDETLTGNEDTFIGTAGDDTFTATSATLTADDNIVDTTSTDNDVMNVTLTAAAPVMDVTGVETININWDSLLTPAVDLDDVSGATVNITTAKTGQNGDADVTNAGANSVVFGAGFDRDVTVAGSEGSVEATVADSITLTAADGTVSVTGAAATTVSVAGGDAVTINAVAADDIDVTGADAETVDLTVGVDAAVNVVGSSAAVTAVSITSGAAAAVEMTIENTSAYASLALSGLVNLSAEVADVSAKTITGAGVVTISDAIADINISTVTADSFVFETTAGGAAAITMASGQNITIEGVALGGAVTLQTTAAADGTADVANLTLDTETGANALVIDTANQAIETLNVTVAAAATFVNTQDFNISDIQGNSAGGSTINLTQADADVELTVDAFDAAALDGSAVAGELDVTQTSNETLSVIGAAGATTATFAGTTTESTFESTNAADDAVTFVTTTGGATAVFAGGDNTVTADAVSTGTLTVTGGAGDDTVQADGLTTGHLTLALGDGDNTVRIGATGGSALAGASMTMTTGTGDNSVAIEDDTVAAFSATIDLGTGTGTLDITAAADLTAGTLNITGLDVIAIGSQDTAAVVNATLLDGATVTITGDGTAGDRLAVEMDNTAAASVDFSNVSISNDVLTDMGGLQVTGTAVADTIVGTDGSDSLLGMAGTDVLTGGDGADLISLGNADTNADLVSIVGVAAAANSSTVYEFETGTDNIALTNTAGGTAGASAGSLVTVAAIAGLTIDDIVADTAANLGAAATTVGDQSAIFTSGGYAYETDTGQLYYDADGDFTAGAVVVATLYSTQIGGADTAVVATTADFEFGIA